MACAITPGSRCCASKRCLAIVSKAEVGRAGAWPRQEHGCFCMLYDPFCGAGHNKSLAICGLQWAGDSSETPQIRARCMKPAAASARQPDLTLLCKGIVIVVEPHGARTGNKLMLGLLLRDEALQQQAWVEASCARPKSASSGDNHATFGAASTGPECMLPDLMLVAAKYQHSEFP